MWVERRRLKLSSSGLGPVSLTHVVSGLTSAAVSLLKRVPRTEELVPGMKTDEGHAGCGYCVSLGVP